MAISGQKHIKIGAENNSAESDSLHAAFVKVEDNFNNLFANSSQYTTFQSGDGVSVLQNSTLGRVQVTNTGVINLLEGTGIRLSGANGDVTISVSGSANGTLVAGVTKIGVISSTLDVINSPIISEGDIALNLAEVPTISAGNYVSPTVTVDQYGRITQIANTTTTGTVTQVAVTAGDGVAITGSPITDEGEIIINNTGVLRLAAGPGIKLTDTTGNITISADITPPGGTVTRVGVLSETLVVTQSPVTTSGNIVVELPDAITLVGDISADNGMLSGDFEVSGALTIGGATVLHGVTSGAITSSGAITATGNVTGANLVTAGVLTATGNATVGNIIANIANVTTAKVSGNANIGNAIVSGVVTATGNVTGANLVTTGNLTVGGNLNYGRVYGSFYSNATQQLTTANTATAMSLNNTIISQSVSIVDTSKITFAVGGRYNIQFSAQLTKTDAGDDVIDIWLTKNGANEPWTNTDITLVGNNAKAVASWNFVVECVAGDYYQLAWSSPDTNIKIVAVNPATNPSRPGIPSLIVTVTPVGA